MNPGNPRILAPFGNVNLYGQERGNIEALSALKSEGCEVMCLVNSAWWAKEVPKALEAAGFQCRKSPYIYIHKPTNLLWFVLHNIGAFLVANFVFLKAFWDFRPTHIYAFNQTLVLNFLLGFWMTGRPLVYRAGDAPTLHNIFHRWTWGFIKRRAHQFVANSEFIRTTLIRAGVEPGRIRVIYSRPPTRRKDLAALPAELFAGDRQYVVYAGQIIPEKGVELLINAYRKIAQDFPKSVLYLAGDISDWEGAAWARSLRDRVTADDLLSRQVRFLGHVEDIPTLFRNALVHVCPSLTEEPLANVVVEAKAQGRPSIVFPRGGLPELVQDGVDGFVCADATEECLAQALKKYLANPDLADSHGRAARASLERFGIRQFAAKWRNVLDDASPPQSATVVHQGA